MPADIQFKMPFNYVQVLMAAFGATVLSVLIYFVAIAAGSSMHFSGGVFAHLDFIHIIRFIVLPFAILGFITYLIGKGKPGFCRIMQWLGVAVVAVSLVAQFFFADDAGSAIAVAIMHLVVGVSWYIAVDNSNKRANERALLAIER